MVAKRCLKVPHFPHACTYRDETLYTYYSQWWKNIVGVTKWFHFRFQRWRQKDFLKSYLMATFPAEVLKRVHELERNLGMQMFLNQKKITLGVSSRSDFRFPRWWPLCIRFLTRVHVSGRNVEYICFAVRRKLLWVFSSDLTSGFQDGGQNISESSF